MPSYAIEGSAASIYIGKRRKLRQQIQILDKIDMNAPKLMF